jgi:probable rRNA maturation factor
MIQFFVEDLAFKLSQKQIIKRWLKQAALANHKKTGEINYIFCSDVYLLNINKTYLNHDYFTDIITFDNSETSKKIDADIYISINRVEDNAKSLGISTTEELHRVIIHGLLHLLGFKDKTKSDAAEMRSQENQQLALLSNLIQ